MKTEVNLEQWIAPHYLRAQTIKSLAKQYKNNKPFAHIALHGFLHEQIAKELLIALSKEEFYHKKSDLFQLAQNNLIKTKNPILAAFRDVLLSREFTDYMTKITGVKLKNKTLDFNGALYQDTDYLLCHDDELDTRKIAFMLYLSTFTKKDGGSLTLLSTKNKKPNKVAKRLSPKFNTLTFFTVSKASFHEVEEVTSKKQRLTLGGWLHG